MRILYVGDIMGPPGIEVVRRVLPEVYQKRHCGIIVAQGENVTAGRGISLLDYKKLIAVGVDFFTGGNHSLSNKEMLKYLDDPDAPIIRPANLPHGTPGKGWKYIQTSSGPVLIVSLLGQIVGKDAGMKMENPLHVIDDILAQNRHIKRAATIVNIHGDYSSEKVVLGHYLDGKVTAVIGDHWHVPTADAMVLPNGTAHVTDVGMCGILHSSLGVKSEVIIDRWRTGKASRNELATEGPLQFNAVCIDVDEKTGLAKSIEQVRRIIDQ